MRDKQAELVVVMPVYNEAGVIGTVVREWLAVLDAAGMPYRLRVRNDGSTDGTGEVLAQVDHPALEVVTSENRGHGPGILAEYVRGTAEAAWVFQVDSDGEVPAEAFPAFWAARAEADLVIGVRQGRGGPLSRRLVTRGVRWMLRLGFGGALRDGNCPCRLMRAAAFREGVERVPPGAFAPNVLLSGYALRRGLRIREIPVPFRPRQTGVVSIRRGRLLRAVLRSAGQTVAFAWSLGRL